MTDFMTEAENYRMIFDWHTHTVYSHNHHGKGTIEENVLAAREMGLESVAISDHGPGHKTYGIQRKKYPEIRAEIERLKKKYSDIRIYMSVEANIISTGNHLDVKRSEADAFDFIIGGYHYGIPEGYCVANWLDSHLGLPEASGKKLLVKNTDMTVKALWENNLKILTHPGDKGRFDIGEIAKACAARGTLMEISSRHSHLTTEEIKLAAKQDVGFVISSDAHTPQAVGSYRGGVKRALEAGLDMERIVNIKKK